MRNSQRRGRQRPINGGIVGTGCIIVGEVLPGDPILGIVEPGTLPACGRPPGKVPTGGKLVPGRVVPGIPGMTAPGIAGPVVPIPGVVTPGRIMEPPPTDPWMEPPPGLRANADSASVPLVTTTRSVFFDIVFIVDKRPALAATCSTDQRKWDAPWQKPRRLGFSPTYLFIGAKC